MIYACSMTPDERLQLIEDIKTGTRKREEIIRQAETDQKFDLVAAWEVLGRTRRVDCRPNQDRQTGQELVRHCRMLAGQTTLTL